MTAASGGSAAPGVVSILPLGERPDLVSLVCGWGFAEWAHLNPGQTLAQRHTALMGEMQPDRVPMTFVALDAGGACIGTAALLAHDIDNDPRTPWLASVYVPPARRGRGVASRLVRHVEAQAARLGYRRLYLFTESAGSLYARLGWRLLERRTLHGAPILIMERDLDES